MGTTPPASTNQGPTGTSPGSSTDMNQGTTPRAARADRG
jgi:hypothetical protein